MAGKLTLEVVQGPMKGRHFPFDGHDVFVFGRSPDCHMCLPDDPLVSRHHFILEVNPPYARVRDLGSLNGTCVNGAKHGGRAQGETPEDGAKRRHPEVDLKHGDRVEVGDSVLMVHVETPAYCCNCGHEVAAQTREPHPTIAGAFVCSDCRKKLVAAPPVEAPTPMEPVCCQACGKNVSGEAGRGGRAAYVCNACRAKLEADPIALLRQMLGPQAVLGPAGRPAPRIIAVGKRVIAAGEQAPPHIAGYRVEKELGHGAMGIVYKACRERDSACIAIKVMLARVSVDARARELFQREIEVTRLLRRERIVEIFDHGCEGSLFYFDMEFCDGGSVDNLMARNGGKLPLALARPIMLQVLDGMVYAHAGNYVHRDIKPSNVLLKGAGAQQTAKVSDFGLAKNFDRAGFSGMTMTGSKAGTPAFMAREQVTNFKYVKPATDVWSLGATFYNILTGRFPRDMRAGQDPMELVLHGSVVPIRDRDRSIPSKLADVIDRSLQTAVKDRYQDAGQMLEALRRAL